MGKLAKITWFNGIAWETRRRFSCRICGIEMDFMAFWLSLLFDLRIADALLVDNIVKYQPRSG